MRSEDVNSNNIYTLLGTTEGTVNDQIPKKIKIHFKKNILNHY